MVRRWPLVSAMASLACWASKWFCASRNGRPVFSESAAATLDPNSRCVLMPVPTAVPPMGNSASVSIARSRRARP